MGGATKTNFYFSTIFIVAIFSVLVLTLGLSAINNPKITLDNESKNYINSYVDYHTESGFETLSGTTSGESAQQEILTGDNETGEPLATDNIAVPKATQGSLAEFPNFFKLLYNIPTLIFTGLGLPAEPFTNFVNIFSYTMFFILSSVFIKLTFNGGSDN